MATSPAEELLAVEGYWGTEGHFSSVVRFVVGCPCSCGCPHLLHTGSTIRLSGFLLNGYEIGKGCVGGSMRTWKEELGVDIIKIYYIHLQNSQRV